MGSNNLSKVGHLNINWDSEESHLLLNPRLPKNEIEKWEPISLLFNQFPGHVWLTTSGSTQLKLVALHKKAILASAQAVNQHLECNSKDIWINPLPLFHVGGLGILARAYLVGAKVVAFTEKWCPLAFLSFLTEQKGSLTSLVPTQIYDLVTHHLSAPKSLRALIVGGGALSKSLYNQARRLGWPLLPSYGMTECASQIATAPLASLSMIEFPSMQILPHMNLKIDDQHRICLKSPALFSTYAHSVDGKIYLDRPLHEGWFVSSDKGALSNCCLKLLGRVGDFIKIGGESVEFSRLELMWEEIKLKANISFDVVLASVPDSRLGHAIHLFTTHPSVEKLQALYDEKVLPFERIRKVHLVPQIPRSALNKVLKNELLKMVTFERQE